MFKHCEQDKALADACMPKKKFKIDGSPMDPIRYGSLDGPNPRNIGGPLDPRSFGRISFLHLDGPKETRSPPKFSA